MLYVKVEQEVGLHIQCECGETLTCRDLGQECIEVEPCQECIATATKDGKDEGYSDGLRAAGKDDD